MMLEPITFPMAICPWPERADAIDAASSGALVPNPTTVTPMTKAGTPQRTASRPELRTSSSAPETRMPIETTSQKRSTARRIWSLRTAAEFVRAVEALYWVRPGSGWPTPMIGSTHALDL